MAPEPKTRSWMLKLTAGVIACWIVLSWIVGWTAVQAAEQTKTPAQVSETEQAPPAPAAIPASEIIPRAEQTLRTLQETRFQIAADSEAVLNSIQRDIAAFAEKSDRRWQDETEMITKLRSLQRLNTSCGDGASSRASSTVGTGRYPDDRRFL